MCPEPETATPEPQPGDGRVHAGKLSYPELGSPWSAPEPEGGVAFGKGVLIQSVEIERTPANQRWLAAVLVGELVAGDGFFSPKDGAAIVVKCVSGTFYGDSAVTRDDKRNEAIRVDDHDAWVIESQLGFDVPGIQAKSERLIVVIVDTGGARRACSTPRSRRTPNNCCRRPGRPSPASRSTAEGRSRRRRPARRSAR